MRIRSESDFDTLLRGAKLLAAAAAWTEQGYWDRLAVSERPVAAEELGGDTRAVRITATILMHAGLLNGGAGRFELSSLGRQMHEHGQMPTFRTFETLEDLSRLQSVLVDGGPVRAADGQAKVTRGGVSPEDVERSRSFLDMLYRRSAGSSRVAAEWIAGRVSAGGSVIDIGGGHGRYSEELAARGYKPCLFDFPHVIEIARERHGDKLAYRAGDFHEQEFGGPYDAAFLSNIVHGESDRGNERLVSRLYESLRPGGWLVIKDMFLDELGNEPESAVFFALTMLYYTAEGNSYSLRDVGRWCRRAGFEEPDAVAGEGYSLVFARRPAE